MGGEESTSAKCTVNAARPFAHNPALRNCVGIQGKRTRIFALQVIFRLNSSFYSNWPSQLGNVGCTDRPDRDQRLASQCQIH